MNSDYKIINSEAAKVGASLLQGADSYHTGHAKRLIRTLEILANLKPKGQILDIGSSGFLPLACRELFPDLVVHTTHYEKTESSFAPYEYSLAGRSITVDTAFVDLEHDKLPLETGVYDVVICCEVLEHMEIDPMFMLAEMNRVAKDCASLLLTTPNVLSSRGLTKMVNGIEPYFYMQYHKSREYHRHNYEYSARSLEKLLMYAGFTSDVWTEDLFEEGMPDVVKRLRAAGFMIRNVGDNLIAVGTKTSPVIDRWPHGFYV
jgi:2-polyprenyl-3-methyl-5-hydroxy-6-metoxy-1,4-benzoquinol methylase